LDWLLIWSRRHLEHVLAVYVERYNTARPATLRLLPHQEREDDGGDNGQAGQSDEAAKEPARAWHARR
jgi:hypothetical protein